MSEEWITLRDTRDAGGTRYLGVRLSESGDLLINGQDLGPAVEEFFGPGTIEYEWIWRVSAGDIPRLSAALGGSVDDLLVLLEERFAGPDAPDLDRFLEESGVPVHRWSRFGD